MTTMGLRGGLAGIFLVSAGVAGSYEPMARPPAALQAGVPSLSSPASVPSAGFLQQLLARSCETSLAAQRRDSRQASERRGECQRREPAASD